MLDYLKKRPMLLCALGSVVICIVGFYSGFAVYITGFALIALFFTAIYFKVKPELIFVIFMMFLTVISVLLKIQEIDEINAAGQTAINETFIVVSEPENRGAYSSVTLQTLGGGKLPKGTNVYTFFRGSAPEYGEAVEAEIELVPVSDEYKKYDYSNEIYISGSAEELKVTGGDFILQGVNGIRKYIKSVLFSELRGREAGTLAALIMGDRSYFSEEFNNNIRNSGTSHVMVVSGMHLAVIVGFITSLSGIFFYNRFFKAFTVFLTVLFMAALCGFTMSVLRAGVTYLLYSAAIIFERESTPENTLGGAVVLILLFQPFAVFNISFQLSVLSTLGITAAALPVIKYFKNKIRFKILLAFISSAVISLSALIFTLPAVINTFGYVSCISVPASILISPAVTVALSFALGGILLSLIAKPLSFLLLYPAGTAAVYINKVINLLGSLPFAAFDTGRYAFTASLTVLLVLIIALFACKRRSDMIKLKRINEKIIKEGGGKLKWV